MEPAQGPKQSPPPAATEQQPYVGKRKKTTKETLGSFNSKALIQKYLGYNYPSAFKHIPETKIGNRSFKIIKEIGDQTQGIMRKVDGTVFYGNFLNNAPEGRGLLEDPNGNFLEATWEKGQASGEVTWYTRMGNKYSGEWDGKGWVNNKAKIEYKNGDVFQGRFSGEFGKYFERQGEGFLEKTNGKIYRGFFNEDKFARGEITFEEASLFATYKGDVQADSFHGQGELVFKDGRKIVGTFENGRVKQGRLTQIVNGKEEDIHVANLTEYLKKVEQDHENVQLQEKKLKREEAKLERQEAIRKERRTNRRSVAAGPSEEETSSEKQEVTTEDLPRRVRVRRPQPPQYDQEVFFDEPSSLASLSRPGAASSNEAQVEDETVFESREAELPAPVQEPPAQPAFKAPDLPGIKIVIGEANNQFFENDFAVYNGQALQGKPYGYGIMQYKHVNLTPYLGVNEIPRFEGVFVKGAVFNGSGLKLDFYFNKPYYSYGVIQNGQLVTGVGYILTPQGIFCGHVHKGQIIIGRYHIQDDLPTTNQLFTAYIEQLRATRDLLYT